MKYKYLLKFVPLIFSSVTFIGCDVIDFSILYSSPLIPNDSIQINKIWDTDKYCAFTSLIKYQDLYYCAFREGVGHAGDNGSIRILVSSDAKKWEEGFFLSIPGFDLRDPNLSIMPDGKLMLLCGRYDGSSTQTIVSFLSGSNSSFSSFEEMKIPEEIKATTNWIWRATWIDEVCYGAKYGGQYVEIVKSQDGINWSYVSSLKIEEATEVQLQPMNSGKMVALVRTNSYGRVCYSDFPYEDWTICTSDLILQGQSFVVSSNNKIVCAVRAYGTSLFYSVTDSFFSKLCDFTSGTDNGYPSIFVEDDRLIVSYYAASDTSSDIFIAEIPIKCLEDRGIFFK